MPIDDMDAILNKIEEMVISLNDDYMDRDIVDTGLTIDEKTPPGIRARRGAIAYLIIGHAERDYLKIIVATNLASLIANRLLTGPEYTEKQDHRSTDEAIGDAIEVINSIPQQDMDRFGYYLRDKIASEHAGATILRTDEGATRGFTVSRKIFPGSDRFGLRELDRSIQTVVSLGWRGNNFVTESFNLDSISEPTDIELTQLR